MSCDFPAVGFTGDFSFYLWLLWCSVLSNRVLFNLCWDVTARPPLYCCLLLPI